MPVTATTQNNPGTYLIRRIRLINFHNFVDEIIDLQHGGHLFLLGDNASGKTTVLDAVHYVLTAGELMEFNSAARVAGSRDGGRRVQGVIMRYNVDTGPLNPGGGITYAAVEVSGRHGNPTTFAIGMTVRAMDEKVNRWGIIREAALEDIPFVVADETGRRPATREELRDRLGRGSGYYSSLGPYQREVAQRLFGSWEVFVDACRLLSTGKAYREIVSHTADYHQLFKQLLPEPRSDTFEEIISTLKSLDESTADLRRFEEKLAYLGELSALVERIAAARREQARLRWLQQYLVCAELQERIDRLREAREDRSRKLAACEEEVRACRENQEHQRRRIDDLKQKDGAGLIAREHDLAADVETLVCRDADLRGAVAAGEKVCHAAMRQQEKLFAELRHQLGRFYGDVTRLAPTLPFSLNELSAAIDQGRRAEAPQEQVDSLPLEACRAQCRRALEEPQRRLALIQDRREQHEKSLETWVDRLAELESQDEILPDIPGFREALGALQRQGLNAIPLYAGLEWQRGVSRGMSSAIEEAVGEDVLATFVVAADAYATAREIVLRTAPGLRVSQGGADATFPDWLRRVFDVSRSDPAALTCLAAEMVSGADPAVLPFAEHQVLRFRAHERRLAGGGSCLIGQEGRRHALARQCTAVKTQIAGLKKELSALEDEEKQLQAVRDRLHECDRLLVEHSATLRRAGAELRQQTQETSFRQTRLADLTKQRDQVAENLHQNRQRLEELRRLIAAEGLDKLEQRIRRADAKLQRFVEEENELHTRVGEVRNQLRGLEDTLKRLGGERDAAQGRLEAEAAAVRAGEPGIEDVAGLVFATDSAAGFSQSSEVGDALAGLTHREGVLLGELQSLIRHPVYGAVYGFSYAAASNDLLDRRAVGIQELTQVQQAHIEEQREVINSRTHELFRKLVLEGTLDFLSRHVRDLRAMVRRINHLLGEREFGRSRYRFQLEEVESYKRLIHIVQSYHPFAVDRAAEDLRLFFEDHRADIIETEVNQVPEVLDYRNWFHYDMKVQTLDREDVLMDRRTKSVGSGGEQAVPNYLLILTVADFLFRGNRTRLHALIFDEAFYGIDSGRRDQLLGFATDLGLQLFVASPDQDGVKREVAYSTTILVVKDEAYDVHLFPYHWENPELEVQPALFEEMRPQRGPIEFGSEL